MANNPAVMAKDPATLLHIILTGSKSAETAAHPRVF
jgi:thiosulfate dehydrogenase